MAVRLPLALAPMALSSTGTQAPMHIIKDASGEDDEEFEEEEEEFEEDEGLEEEDFEEEEEEFGEDEGFEEEEFLRLRNRLLPRNRPPLRNRPQDFEEEDEDFKEEGFENVGEYSSKDLPRSSGYSR